jgi:hypothetical protein
MCSEVLNEVVNSEFFLIFYRLCVLCVREHVWQSVCD